MKLTPSAQMDRENLNESMVGVRRYTLFLRSPFELASGKSLDGPACVSVAAGLVEANEMFLSTRRQLTD